MLFQSELIDTCWDVNDSSVRVFGCKPLELIDTCCDVNG